MPTFGGGVDSKELAIFTRQFSVMIDAGLPLVQCLEILAGQQEKARQACDEALRLDPKFKEGQDLMRKIANDKIPTAK